jgi:hypothetical protein
MDFIFTPDNASMHMPVSDLGGPEYDNQGFLGYDQRQGWNIAALRNGDVAGACDRFFEFAATVIGDIPLEDVPTDEEFVRVVVGAFIQTWILFGILQEALRRPVFRHEVSQTVTTTGPDGKVSSSKQITLRNAFKEFLAKEDELRADAVWATHLTRCLRDAAAILVDLDFLFQKVGGFVVPMPVHLALSVLVQSLNYYRVVFQRQEPQLDNNFLPGQCQQFESKLLDDWGWCPNMMQRIFSSLGLGGLYYATLLPGFGLSKGHDKCKVGACAVSNIDYDKYEAIHDQDYCRCRDPSCVHRRPECLCPYIGVQMPEAIEAFEDGGFPLIKFHHDRFTTIGYKTGMAYVAISHVWSDGRGNLQENALPECQLQRIRQYVTSLAPSVDSVFWIDTLCVPLREPLRNTAIMRMAQVYSSASQVLTLSSDLLSHNLPSSPDEASFRIFCSQWAARLWTMQEAILAKELVFQFADHAINYSTLEEQIIHADLNIGEQSRQFGSLAHHYIQFMKRRIHFEHNFPLVWLWYGLRYRTTSRPSDVAICGSILLGYGLERVLSVPDEEKIQTFWFCQKTAPVSVLWAGGPRLRIDGLRWAPSNLLNPETSTQPANEDGPSAEPTPAGLLVSGVQAVVLENVPLPDDESAVFRFLFPSIQRRYFCIRVRTAETETWAELRHLWTGRCVLLMPETISQSPLAALTVPKDDVSVAGASAGQETGPIRVRYVAQVWVLLETGFPEGETLEVKDGFDALRLAIQNDMIPVSDIADSSLVEPSQTWCVF